MTDFKRAELELTLQLEDHARFIKEQQAAEALAARRLADLHRHLRRMLADDDEPGMHSCCGGEGGEDPYGWSRH